MYYYLSCIVALCLFSQFALGNEIKSDDDGIANKRSDLSDHELREFLKELVMHDRLNDKRALPRMGKRFFEFDEFERPVDQPEYQEEAEEEADIDKRGLPRMGKRALPRMGRSKPIGRALPRMGRALPRMG